MRQRPRPTTQPRATHRATDRPSAVVAPRNASPFQPSFRVRAQAANRCRLLRSHEPPAQPWPPCASNCAGSRSSPITAGHHARGRGSSHGCIPAFAPGVTARCAQRAAGVAASFFDPRRAAPRGARPSIPQLARSGSCTIEALRLRRGSPLARMRTGVARRAPSRAHSRCGQAGRRQEPTTCQGTLMPKDFGRPISAGPSPFGEPARCPRKGVERDRARRRRMMTLRYGTNADAVSFRANSRLASQTHHAVRRRRRSLPDQGRPD